MGKPEVTVIAVFTTYDEWIYPSIVEMLLNARGRHRIRFENVHALFPISMARNVAVTNFLKSDADNLLFLDNDMDPPGKHAGRSVRSRCAWRGCSVLAVCRHFTR